MRKTIKRKSAAMHSPADTTVFITFCVHVAYTSAGSKAKRTENKVIFHKVSFITECWGVNSLQVNLRWMD